MIVTGNEQEAEDFIKERLLTVTAILDEIADQTGQLYVCLLDDTAKILYKFGEYLGSSLLQAHEIVANRVVLANNQRKREHDWLTKHGEKSERKEAE